MSEITGKRKCLNGKHLNGETANVALGTKFCLTCLALRSSTPEELEDLSKIYVGRGFKGAIVQ